MATAQLNPILHYLHQVALRNSADQPDEELLTSFVGARDSTALATLVERHGPMVWGVCRRLLQNHHDAEDAFQATFLVFVRKAATIRHAELVANWLYGVAHQTAMRSRVAAAKRGSRERQVPVMPEPADAERNIWDDLQPVLDQELSRLPDKYRRVVVLCDLEGNTRAEAARQLGCPEGTVAGQLFRAREMLAKRLARQGLAVSGAVLGAVLPAHAATALPPALLLSSTIQAASLYAAGQATAGAISTTVVALSEGVLKAMFLTRLKLFAALTLVVSTFALCGAALQQTLAAPGGTELRVLAQERKKAAPKDANQVRGTLAGVDPDKNTVTITTRTFDRMTGESTETNKTYAVAKDARIVQDDATAKLVDLKKGYTAILKVDGTTAISLSVEGGTGQAEFHSFNPQRNTIVVIAGRDMARRVVHLLKETKVTGADGKPIRVEELKPGTKIQITRSVEDDNTAIRIQLQTATAPKKRER